MTVGVACGESERSNGDGGGSGGIQSAGGNGAQGGGGTSGLGNGGDPSLGSGGTEPVGKPQIIDTHIHLWDLARDPQFDDGMTRLPADYETQARDAGITGCVLVEAVWSTLGDNQWGLQLAEENQFIVGVVGSLPVSSDQFLTNVATLASHSLFRGLRLGSVADLGSAKMSALIDRGLSVDVNVNGPEAILQLAAAAAAVPDLTVILDHAGGLSFVDTPSQAWVDAMHQLAANPNVVCKFSRFQEQAGSTPATTPEAYTAAFGVLWDEFGEERLMFGTNWPLSLKAGTLTDAVAIAKRPSGELTESAVQKLLWRNARRIYKLDV